MRAVRLMAPGHVVVDRDAPEPELRDAGDCIIEVDVAGICGTDLHPYRGHIANFTPRTIMGHEFVGRIVAAGSGVERRRLGELVVVSDLVACGACAYCAADQHYQCREVQLFGYGDVVGAYLPGGQAERVRVPRADLATFPVPEGLSPRSAVFAADVLTTAFAAVEFAAGERSGSLAVVGCGPVGLAVVLCGLWKGFERIVAIDTDASRRVAASRLGATGVAADADEAAELLPTRGAHAVVEAVGASQALATAVEIAGPRAWISSVGAPHGTGASLPAETAFGRELTLRFIVGNPLALAPRVLSLMASGELDPAPIVSHVLALDDAPAGYAAFDRRGAVKVLLEP
ncbi:MAG: alcohol dehydrogenase catalytic domain-containing protein [Acidimicrobiia bacterium]